MFVPQIYEPVDGTWTAELVRKHPLAVLVTAHAGQLLATHVPTLIVDSEDADGIPPVVYGHMNRENPHWHQLPDGVPAVLLFQGAQGYVSPSVYQTCPAAPTWDFTAVHVHGSLCRITDPAQTFEIVKATAGEFEHRFGGGWDMAASLGYFERLLPGVGAFRISVEKVEGMFKLSQEQPPEVRTRVADAFARSNGDTYRNLAGMMARLPGHVCGSGVSSARRTTKAG